MSSWSARVRAAWVWIREHSWIVLSALGALAAMLFWRRRKPGVEPVDIEIATELGRAQERQQQAKDLEPVADKLKEQLEADEIEIDVVEEARQEDLSDASDAAIDAWFRRHGAHPSSVRSVKKD
jgi:hypothetical protein